MIPLNGATTSFGFPFSVTESGRISATGGDEAIRGKIIQVLFTAPGERVHRPEFGCGLLNLVFEPNEPLLATAQEFTIRQALARWLSRDIVVDAVSVQSVDESMTVEVAYTKKQDLARQAVRIRFK